jgi:thymidylate synthase ThyX
LGYDTPSAIDEAGSRTEWEEAMGASAAMERRLRDEGLEEAAQYAVAMAYKIRFVMQMNAREAMHLTELRSQPQGHPTYRRVAQEMHRLISGVHPALGQAFTYMSDEDVDLERLQAERRTEAKRNAVS